MDKEYIKNSFYPQGAFLMKQSNRSCESTDKGMIGMGVKE